MEMYWNQRNHLKFQVHMKPNQKLKYLNGDSTHMPSTFQAIPSGVLGRLNKLTSKSKKLDKTTVDKVYPRHAQALCTAGIAHEIFPTFLQLEKLQEKFTPSEKAMKKKAKEKKRRRDTYFCIGVSNCSKHTHKPLPFHAIIKKIERQLQPQMAACSDVLPSNFKSRTSVPRRHVLQVNEERHLRRFRRSSLCL